MSSTRIHLGEEQIIKYTSDKQFFNFCKARKANAYIHDYAEHTNTLRGLSPNAKSILLRSPHLQLQLETTQRMRYNNNSLPVSLDTCVLEELLRITLRRPPSTISISSLTSTTRSQSISMEEDLLPSPATRNRQRDALARFCKRVRWTIRTCLRKPQFQPRTRSTCTSWDITSNSAASVTACHTSTSAYQHPHTQVYPLSHVPPATENTTTRSTNAPSAVRCGIFCANL